MGTDERNSVRADVIVPFVLRGRPERPRPFAPSDDVVRLRDCPSCGGRGWFLIEPFKTHGLNGAGGLGNMCQCLTCLDAHAYFKENGRLPSELAHLLEAVK